MKGLLLRLLASAVAFIVSLAWTGVVSNLFIAQAARNEVRAMRLLHTINQAQLQYAVTKGRGRFTDLQTLGKEGLIDAELASGTKDGYVFSSVAINPGNGHSMFDTSASPQPSAIFKLGRRSFYSNETFTVFEREGVKPPTATFIDRIPKDGELIQ